VLVGELLEEEPRHEIVGLDGLLRVEHAPPPAVGVLLDDPPTERIEKAQRAPAQLLQGDLQTVTVFPGVGELAAPLEHFLDGLGHAVGQAGLEEQVLAIEQRDEVRADGEAPDVLVPGGHVAAAVRAVAAVGTLAAHHLPALVRHAVGDLAVVVGPLLQLAQVVVELQQVAVGNVDAGEPLDVLIQRIEELAADVRVGLAEVDVQDVRGDVTGDLHEGDDVFRGAPGDLQPRRRDRFDGRELLPERLDDPPTGQCVEVVGRVHGHAVGAERDLRGGLITVHGGGWHQGDRQTCASSRAPVHEMTSSARLGAGNGRHCI